MGIYDLNLDVPEQPRQLSIPMDDREILHLNLKLWGNSEIGMVANAQAGLNHSGLLTLNQVFSVSNVVDAVNYKTGDVTPVLDGLMDTYCWAVRNGKPLARSAATMRVLPRLKKYWDANGLRDSLGPIENYIQWIKVPWIDAAEDELKDCVAEAFQRLRFRELRANGPIKNLTSVMPARVYEHIFAFMDWRDTQWANFMKELADREGEIKPEERRFKSKLLNQQVEASFLNYFHTLYEECQPQDKYAWGDFCRAYQQAEAVKTSRWAGQRPLTLHPIIAMHQAVMDLTKEDDNADNEHLAFEVMGWNQCPAEESILVKAPEPINLENLDATDKLFVTWDGKLLTFDDSYLTTIAVTDKLSVTVLDHALLMDEKRWLLQGMVGGNSDVAVFTPASPAVTPCA